MAARTPALSQTRMLRWRLESEPAGGSCASTWPAAIFGSSRRDVVDPQGEAEIAGDGGRVVGAAVRQIRHLHLAGFQRETHRRGGKHEVGRRKRAGEHEKFARAPHAGSQSHECNRSYYRRPSRPSPQRPRSAQRLDALRVLRFNVVFETLRRRTLRAHATCGSVRRWPRPSTTDAGKVGEAVRASTATNCGAPARNAIGDRFVLVGLAGTGRVDQTSAGRDRFRGVAAACRAVPRRAARDRSRAGASGCPGSRRSVPRPEQGASTSTQSKRRRERQRRQEIRLHEPDVGWRRSPRRSGAAAPCAGCGRRRR